MPMQINRPQQTQNLQGLMEIQSGSAAGRTEQAGNLNGRQVARGEPQARAPGLLGRVWIAIRNFFTGGQARPVAVAQPEVRSAPPEATKIGQTKAPKVMGEEALKQMICFHIANNRLDEFNEVAGINESRMSYLHYQNDVFKNPVMQEVLDAFRDQESTLGKKEFSKLLRKEGGVFALAIQAAKNFSEGTAPVRTDTLAALDKKSNADIMAATIKGLAAEQFDIGNAIIGLSDVVTKLNLMDHRQIPSHKTTQHAADLFKESLAALNTAQLQTINKNLAASDLAQGWVSMKALGEQLADRLAEDNPDVNIEGFETDTEFLSARTAAEGKLKHMSDVCGGIEGVVADLLTERGFTPEIAKRSIEVPGWDPEMDFGNEDIRNQYAEHLNKPEVAESVNKQQLVMDVRNAVVAKFADFVIAHGGDVRQAVRDVRSGKTDDDLLRLMVKPDIQANPVLFGLIAGDMPE